MDGRLNVMVVTPQVTSVHPEWRELFDQSSQAIQQQFLNMRHLGRRIGYFITDIRKGTHNRDPLVWSNSLIRPYRITEENGDDFEKIHARERGNRGKTADRAGSSGEEASSSGSGSRLKP